MFGTSPAPEPKGADVNRLLNDLWSELGMIRPAVAEAMPASVTPVSGSSGASKAVAKSPKTTSLPRPVAAKPQAASSVTSSQPTAATAASPRVVPARPVAERAPEVKSIEVAPVAVESMLPATSPMGFFPKAVRTLKEVGSSEDEVGRSILKLLAARGAHPGRKIAAHLKLLFPIVEEILRDLRKDQFVAMKGEGFAGDYTYVTTDKGLTYAKEFARECTYFGATPVTLGQYCEAVKAQCVAEQKIKAADLKRAFHDLQLEDSLMQTLGPAVNSGRGMFLFGQPGNGKTSVAERVARSFGEAIWIPRALGIDGQIIRVFDPSIHEEVGKDDPQIKRLDPVDVDQRWVRVRRPTVVAGGELTMDELEVTQDKNSGICEAPLQLKSNGGVLLIDDFGRQRMPVDELLNRWIIPLEKRYDLLNLPSGKKVQVPFDQLVIFSTNLEPKDLVDDAFLRRIPYKIEVPDPTPKQFHHIFEIMCSKLGIPYDIEMVNYLIETHYLAKNRAMRACHPRDLLMQIKNLCIYEDREPVMTKEAIEFAVRCYFSVLG